MADPETNKQTVPAYYNMAFNERKPAEAAKKYGGPRYIQHNPQAPDGFEAFVHFVEGFVEQFPEMSLEIKRAVAEGEIVVRHSLIETSPEDRGTAAADFFRLEEGEVVEHCGMSCSPCRRARRTITPCSDGPRTPGGALELPVFGWRTRTLKCLETLSEKSDQTLLMNLMCR